MRVKLQLKIAICGELLITLFHTLRDPHLKASSNNCVEHAAEPVATNAGEVSVFRPVWVQFFELTGVGKNHLYR